MASHVVGPLLIAERPLTEVGRSLLESQDTWTFDLLNAITLYPVRKRPASYVVAKPVDTMTVAKQSATYTVEKTRS